MESHNCIYGPVDDKNHQHCTICGKAIKVDCNHKWEMFDSMEYKKKSWWDGTEYPVKVIFSQCVYCGETKKQTL